MWRPSRSALGLFLGLDALPGALDPGGCDVAVPVGEDVRMPADHFPANRFNDVAKAECVLLLGHPGVIDDLEQEVAEFVLEVIEIVAANRVGDFVGFLDRVRRDGREILLQIPRAAGSWRAQRRHDLDQPGKVAGGLHDALKGKGALTLSERPHRFDC